MKLEFEQATLQFQAVDVKDNHKQIDCVWNDTNLLDESIYAYHVLYQNKKKRYVLEIQISFIGVMHHNRK